MNKILRRLQEAEKLIDVYEKYDHIDIEKDKNGNEYFYITNLDCSLCTNYYLSVNGYDKGDKISITLYFEDKDLDIKIYYGRNGFLEIGKLLTKKWLNNSIWDIGSIGKLNISETIRDLKNRNCNPELLLKIEQDLISKQSTFAKLKERIGKYK